ncbi:MAG: LmbE family protein [Flavobacteriaceae bacterium]|nr:LmbE family protein [Flavobacteriaceae bacterium]|tara:strand:+ start:25620 stop:28160 length:2541 start_codon:yes stop_codon:yes gene_type:complete
MRKIALVLFVTLCYSVHSFGQKPKKLTSNQIYEKIQKLNFLGTALYIAAHPDDENTRLIAYLANQVKARTGYLSLTRGDGGQNLIGPEIRELLGVIRTQELLAARGVDGGEQLFTRANDFGYSKHPDETLEIWDEKQVLSDVVWAIRNFKPDIIINRFNHRTPGTTHGHHTASAMLSVEAFDLVGDATKFKDQLKQTETWQPKRLFFNTSWWFYGSQQNFEKATKGNPNFLSFDVGVYYPLKGLSNNELASIASSQHLCQGFGRLTTRGSQTEYVELLKGQPMKDQSDLFSGINTTWNRIEGGGEIGDILYEVEDNFDFVNPSKHLPALIEAYKKIEMLGDAHWRDLKLKQIREVIEACAGLYLEVSASASTTTTNAEIDLNIEALNRNSDASVFLQSITFEAEKRLTWVQELQLKSNQKQNLKKTISVGNLGTTDPYWLRNEWSLGMYKVDDRQMIGKPETPRAIRAIFNLIIDEVEVSIPKDVIYRYSRRDKGELYEPLEILPKVTTSLKEKVMIFSGDEAKNIKVGVRAGTSKVSGTLALQVPAGWKVAPARLDFSIDQKGEEQIFEFEVVPPKNQSEGYLKAVATVGGEFYAKELVEINYEHIPKQSVLLPSKSKIVRLDIQKAGNYIGYIKGAGDAIPESLTQIGYTVVPLNVDEINAENLAKFDAVVLGIRAYNTVPQLKYKQKFLLDYVKNGGNMIVQYNTSGRRGGVDVMAPYQLSLSRDRVTDEYAKVNVLAKDHSVMNFPNKIEAKDFEGWVQERGLYFPNQWGAEFTPILSMNDKGESPKKGSLLVAKYGKGNYIYTGLSFFRELPAGVPGAYKLFANILSIGKENIKLNNQIKQ